MSTSDKHQLCRTCNNERRYHQQSTAAAAALVQLSTPPAIPSPPLTQHNHLTEDQRWMIVSLHKDGQNNDTIAAKVLCHVQSVQRWIEHYNTTQSVQDNRRSGRKRKLTAEDSSAIITSATNQPRTTPKVLRRELQLSVSARTIRRTLDSAGLPGRVAQVQHPFTSDNLRARRSFGEGYSRWKEDWHTVIFSDETSMPLGPSGREYVQRPPGQALNPKYTIKKKTHYPKAHMWGCFCSKGVGANYIFTDNLDKVLLRHILSTNLIRAAHRFFPSGQWWLLHDNDPKHTSGLVRDWCHNNGVSELDFPPYSPDLNPIENVWSDWKRRVHARNASTMDELKQYMQEEWDATNPSFLAKLVNSMPKRCKAVVANQGHKTTY
jgi:transposase